MAYYDNAKDTIRTIMEGANYHSSYYGWDILYDVNNPEKPWIVMKSWGARKYRAHTLAQAKEIIRYHDKR